MRTEIEYSPAYTMLTLELSSGESVKAEPGAMVAQQDVEMTTGMGGGGLMGRPEAHGRRRVVLREYLHLPRPRQRLGESLAARAG